MVKPVTIDGKLTPLCPHCNVPAVVFHLPPGTFGQRNPRRWECPMQGCDARVGIHENSKRDAPLGTLAREPLRRHRMSVHGAFDPLWRHGPACRFPTRRKAYEWLANALGIDFNRCHVGEFDHAMCARAQRAIAELMEVPR